MENSGAILKICAFVAAILGAAAGVIEIGKPLLDGNYFLGVAEIVGGVTIGALLYGIGGSFQALNRIDVNSERTAAALESLARSRRRPQTPSK